MSEMNNQPNHSQETVERTGRCVCGEVSYVAKNVKSVWYCHCRECRRMTGHFMAACQVDLTDITIKGEPKWYYVSEKSRHGHCPTCGCQMFWRNEQNPYMSLTAGCIDNTDGLSDEKGHIYVGEKGDYYKIPDADIQCETYK